MQSEGSNDKTQSAVSKEMIAALALANGLSFPEERLERILRQYQTFLHSLEQLDSLALAREATPEFVFELPQPARR